MDQYFAMQFLPKEKRTYVKWKYKRSIANPPVAPLNDNQWEYDDRRITFS